MHIAFDPASDRAKAQETAGSVEIGRTIASLGAATEPGFWMKTRFVDVPTKGARCLYGEGQVGECRSHSAQPPATACSQMSLAALRLVEAPLTGLPDMQVFKTR
ncbi:hypothetical protein KUD11_13495 [Roseovarius sp. LXJ103]|uniref:hypothetical protein n=1 Tax=Roseovarius carneus TaxID=2853164 RepID=UPI000D60A45B|nr:hypothetical protein [Roseovarius carneus]MBZ8119657.1 hypothetical protein [Roseovarius carneus]PWE34728.1 hypothetical protein DD563_01250 [Pelagicola sp. LXJ1103]